MELISSEVKMTMIVAGAVVTIGLLVAGIGMCCGGSKKSGRGKYGKANEMADEDDDDEEWEEEEEEEEERRASRQDNGKKGSLALTNGGGGKKGDRTTKVAPKVGYRTKGGKAIKVFVEVDGAVHVLRISMQPVESVEDLYEALGVACVESGAPELRDLDFSMDSQLELQYLDDHDQARPVQDDTPIGILKCAKAMRAFRSSA